MRDVAAAVHVGRGVRWLMDSILARFLALISDFLSRPNNASINGSQGVSGFRQSGMQSLGENLFKGTYSL